MPASDSDLSNRDVALLIDWEAAISGTHAARAPAIVSAIIESARAIGSVSTARAYGDWSLNTNRTAVETLIAAGVDPVMALSTSGAHAASTSLLRLCIDAVDQINRSPKIGVLFVVGNEVHAAPLFAYAKLRGVRVIVNGGVTISPPGSTPMIVPVPSPLPGGDGQSRSGSGTGFAKPAGSWQENLDSVFTWVTEILLQFGTDGRLPWTQLGSLLLLRHGFKVQDWFGPSMQFKTLMEFAERQGILRIFHDEKNSEWAQLLDSTLVGSTPGSIRSQVDRLSPADRVKLFDFLKSVTSGEDLNRNDLAEMIVGNTILPNLSYDQVGQLLQELLDRNVLILRLGQSDNEEFDEWFVPLDYNERSALESLQPSSAEPPMPIRQESEIDELFSALLAAINQARAKSGFAYQATIKVILEEKIGKPLTALGYRKPNLFFAEAAARGFGYDYELPGAGTLFLVPGERPPTLEEVREARAILPKLSAEVLRDVLRVIAACEDGASVPIKSGSIVRQIRSMLDAKSDLGLTPLQITRLFQSELPERGLVEAIPEEVPNRETGLPIVVERYRLNREAPLVKEALAEGTAQLDPTVELMPFR